MTLPDILANEELRRHEFPVANERLFFAHAGVCPLPRRVAEAIRNYAKQCTLGDQETLLPAFQLQRSRELAARLLHAQPEEIAFVGPTSLALSFISGGIAIEQGANVVGYFDDYPSNVYPWMALAEKGVAVHSIRVRELGRIELSDVAAHVDERTRLVALASCHFVAGHRIDLKSIGGYLRSRRILFCVDAIQTLGAFPTTVEEIDFLAADAHKWLLGPCAAGILYVRKTLQEATKPTAFGWNNVRCPDFVAAETMVLRTDARRYEAGTHNLLGLVGLNAAMELVLEIGIESISAELLRKRGWLVPALQAKGCIVLQAEASEFQAGGIISFWRPGTDLAALQQKLEKANITVSLRADRAGQKYIRLSPHFYNTDAELHRLLELL